MTDTLYTAWNKHTLHAAHVWLITTTLKQYVSYAPFLFIHTATTPYGRSL